MIALRLRNENGVIREVIFDKLPLFIGRRRDNDFILFDNSVSLSHAKIAQDENGKLVLIDLSSRNGLRQGNHKLNQINIDGLTRCFVGMTEIEIEPLSTENTRIIASSEWRELNRRRTLPDHVRIMGLAIIGWFVMSLIDPRLWSPERDNLEVLLAWNFIGVTLMLPCVAFILLIILRTIGRRVRIADTLHALCQILWIFCALEMLELILYYPFSSTVYELIHVVSMGLAFSVAITIIATLRKQPLTSKHRLSWAIGAALLYCTLHGISAFNARIEGRAATSYFIMSPWNNYPGLSISTDRYFKNVAAAAAQTDKEAAQMRREGNE